MTGRFSGSGINSEMLLHTCIQFPESLQNGLFCKMQFQSKKWAQRVWLVQCSGGVFNDCHTAHRLHWLLIYT